MKSKKAVIMMGLLLAVSLVFAATSDTTAAALQIGNTAPTITYVSTISAQDPTAGTTTSVDVTFQVTDTNGYADIDNTTVNAIFTKTGEATRTNVTGCTQTADTSITLNFTCTVPMQFYDLDGAWSVNVSAKDDSASHVENSTTTFTYNTLTGMTMTPTAINWGSLSLGDTNQAATDDPIVVTNAGNQNISAVNVTAQELVGVTNAAYNIGAGNFSTNNVDDCTTGEDALVDNTAVTITGLNITRGAASTGNAYFCANIPSTGITAQVYNTAGSSDWLIGVES